MTNRKIFYQKYREHFGSLRQSQVTGLNFLLDKLDASKKFDLASEYAYILATIKHECADKYKPITEYGSKAYLRSKKYYPYIGRGYVQLTWDFNYEKFGKLLKIDLLGNPDLVLEPETSWKILELGMSKGLYTGKKLGDYVNEDKTNYRNARRVINGLDQASLIASYARKFEECIEFS
ncbi:MAG TPA: glycoside hydrolase family 19 protein [Ignavibacteria bacterium]|jgi:hypothetical protein